MIVELLDARSLHVLLQNSRKDCIGLVLPLKAQLLVKFMPYFSENKQSYPILSGEKSLLFKLS